MVLAAEQVARGGRRLVKARADASATRHLPAAAAVGTTYYLSIGVYSDAVAMVSVSNSSVYIASREYASSISRQHLKNKRDR